MVLDQRQGTRVKMRDQKRIISKEGNKTKLKGGNCQEDNQDAVLQSGGYMIW